MLDFHNLLGQLDDMFPNNAGGASSGYERHPSAMAMNGNGMDVMGSLKGASDFATQYARNPSSGPVAMSDRGMKHQYAKLDDEDDDRWNFSRKC